MAGHKTKNKKLVSFSINEDVVFLFNKHCEKNSINKSLFIENVMKKQINFFDKKDENFK